MTDLDPFDKLWPQLVIPGEFDAMDQCDQQRWKAVLRQAYEAGLAEAIAQAVAP